MCLQCTTAGAGEYYPQDNFGNILQQFPAVEDSGYVPITITTTGTITSESCVYCGNYHNGMCPRIEEIEYYRSGGVKRIKFKGSIV